MNVTRLLRRAAVLLLCTTPLTPAVAVAQTQQPAGPGTPGSPPPSTPVEAAPAPAAEAPPELVPTPPAAPVMPPETPPGAGAPPPGPSGPGASSTTPGSGTVPPVFGGAQEIARPGPGPYLSDFVDTRVTFALTDDDFLADAGRTSPSSPILDFGARRGNETFFNNLDRRDTLRETLSHLVLYRHLPGYFWGVDTEAAIVARFSFFSDADNGRLNQAFRDDGSYLRTSFYPFGDTSDPTDLKFEGTFYPFNTVRYRLGYLYDISWAGPEIFPSRGVAAPGAKLQVSYNKFKWLGGYAYIGAKTARLLDERINEMQANWGGLGGVGVDMLQVLSWEASGGFFQRGTNPLTGVEGQPVVGYGGSTRLLLHLNSPRVESLDFRLMRNDLATANFFLQNKPWASTWAFSLAAEFTWLQHTLQNPDQLQSTLRQNARAAALSARLKLWYFQASADVIVRDLAFVLFNRPGFVPFQAFPGDEKRNLLGAGPGECPFQVQIGPCTAGGLGSVVQPEVLFATGVSAYIPVIRLTPAVIFGVQKPATFQGFLPDSLRSGGVPDTAGSQTVVVRNATDVDILPCAQYETRNGVQECIRPAVVSPIVTTRLAVKWDLSDMMSILAEQVITVDRNRTELINDVDGQNSTRRAFYEADAPQVLRNLGAPSLPMKWGGGLYLQSRF